MIKAWLSAALLLITSLSIVASAQTPRSHIKNGNKYVAQEQYEKALNEYAKVSSNAGLAYSQALYNMGVCYFELWKTDQAIAYFKSALHSRTQGYSQAAYSLGVALESQEKFDEARMAYGQVTSGDRKGAALFRLGVLASDAKVATEFYRRALEVDGPHVASSHNNLGVMLAQRGLVVEAEKEFEMAVTASAGGLGEAVSNLKLCRAMRVSALRITAETQR